MQWLNSPVAHVIQPQDKQKLTPMMQNSKNKRMAIRGNSNLFEANDAIYNSGKKDEDDITKHTPLDEIMKNKAKLDLQNIQADKGITRGETMKSDLTTDLFFNMLNNTDSNNKQNVIGHVNTAAPPKTMGKEESINAFGFGGLNSNLFSLGNISNNLGTNFAGDESTPRNTNTLLPVTQASMNRDFSIVSPNNIIGNNRMRLNPT